MNVYQLNDYEWYATNTHEEAIAAAMEMTGLTREEVWDDGYSSEPISDAELDREIRDESTGNMEITSLRKLLEEMEALGLVAAVDV